MTSSRWPARFAPTWWSSVPKSRWCSGWQTPARRRYRLLRAQQGGGADRRLQSLRQRCDGGGRRPYRVERDRRQPSAFGRGARPFGPAAGDQAWVVKDDRLAAGKGVVVTQSRDAARAHAASLLESGHPVLLESFLDGPECRCSASSTARLSCRCWPRRTSSGSATVTPAPTPAAWAPMQRCRGYPQTSTRAMVRDIVEPVAAELVRRGNPFSGLLYAGLAVTSNGPAVIEFNCRFGDPETQSVLALLDSPLGQLLYATATGKLAGFGELHWRDGTAVTVVLAAENYPSRPRVGDVMVGSEADGVCMPERPVAMTARSCRPAAECSRWSALAQTCPRPVLPPTTSSGQSGCPAVTFALISGGGRRRQGARLVRAGHCGCVRGGNQAPLSGPIAV